MDILIQEKILEEPSALRPKEDAYYAFFSTEVEHCTMIRSLFVARASLEHLLQIVPGSYSPGFDVGH